MAMMTTPGVGFVPRGGPPNYQPPLYSPGPAPYPPMYQGPPPPSYGVSPQDSQVRVSERLFVIWTKVLSSVYSAQCLMWAGVYL